ncbi:MAG: hypothetical protein M3Y77_08110 [Actinomycetota bacterium]|nr:hypothetical protein [Actinomycetota bacterium]
MTVTTEPAIRDVRREVMVTGRGTGLEGGSVLGDDAQRLRVAIHQLAVSRRQRNGTGEYQRTEDTVICLLYPQAVAVANRAAHGELAPPELSRIVSAVLTKAVRAASHGPASEFTARVLATIQGRFAGSGQRSGARSLPMYIAINRPARGAESAAVPSRRAAAQEAS